MNDMLTRFRVYSMPQGGVSMSYSVDSSFILIEARYNSENREKIHSEMKLTGKKTVDLLHISTWHESRCHPEELKSLLDELQPLEIEYPAYTPKDDTGLKSQKLINEYLNRPVYSDGFKIGPQSLMRLSELEDIEYIDPILSPIVKSADESDNSIVKLFKGGKFGVMNLSICSRDLDITDQINEVGLEHSIDIIVVNDFDEMKTNEFFQNLVSLSMPRIIVSLQSKEFFLRTYATLSRDGINISVTEQVDLVVKYNFLKSQQELSYDANKVVIGNLGYEIYHIV